MRAPVRRMGHGHHRAATQDVSHWRGTLTSRTRCRRIASSMVRAITDDAESELRVAASGAALAEALQAPGLRTDREARGCRSSSRVSLSRRAIPAGSASLAAYRDEQPPRGRSRRRIYSTNWTRPPQPPWPLQRQRSCEPQALGAPLARPGEGTRSSDSARFDQSACKKLASTSACRLPIRATTALETTKHSPACRRLQGSQGGVQKREFA